MAQRRCNKCKQLKQDYQLNRAGVCSSCRDDEFNTIYQHSVADDWSPNHSRAAIYDDAPSSNCSHHSHDDGGYSSGYCGGD